jgi:hypothetical protein
MAAGRGTKREQELAVYKAWLQDIYESANKDRRSAW